MSSRTYESRPDRARRTGSPLGALWRSLRAPALALLSSLPLYAAPGDLDPTFGDGGHAAFSFPGQSAAYAQASVLQANGKLTITGACESATGRQYCALRMTSNGALDPSFGDGGRVTISEFKVDANVIAYQDDGRLLLGGHCNVGSGRSPCVVRLQANGALDTSFGVQGVVILSVSTWVARNSLVLSIQFLPDGRIALGVYCQLTGLEVVRFCAVRLQSDGSVDASFGTSGVVTVVPAASQGELQYLRTAAIDAAGRWVMAGDCSGAPPALHSFCAIRLQPNGARDLSFGTNGAFVLGLTDTSVNVQQIKLNTDGGMVVGGGCYVPNPPRELTCFAALTPEGLMDRAFGTDGYAVLSFARGNIGRGRFARSLDGLIIAAEECVTETSASDFCVRLLHSDGTEGSTTRWSQDERPYNQLPISLAVDAQGRIVVSGACESSANSDYNQFCAARYEGGPYANTVCSFDLDGDGQVNPSVDGLILLRATLGFSANSILQGVSFPAGAKRKRWGSGGTDDLRQYLVAQCGMSIVPVANQ